MRSFAGDATAALQYISATTSVMPCETDLYFTAEDAAADVAHIPAGECRVLASDYGHCAGGPGYEAVSTQAILTAMQALLERGS